MAAATKDENVAAKPESPILKRAVNNALFSGLGTLATFALAFVYAGLTIRYLGEARAGYILALQSLLGLNALLIGLETPGVRRVAALYTNGDLPGARVVVGSISVFNIATGLLITLVIVATFPLIFTWSRLDPVYRTDALWATLFLAGSYLLMGLANPWRMVYDALQRYDFIAGLATLFGVLSGTAGIVVLSVAPSMSAIAATGFVVSLLRFITDTLLVRRLLERLPLPTWNWREIRPMLNFGGWTYLGSLGGFLFTNLDRLILTSFLGSAALPYYVIPQRLYSQVHSALSGQSQFLFPMLASFGETAAGEIARLEDRLRWFVALISSGIYTGMALFGPLVLSRLVSPQFAVQATVPLLLACIQGLFHAQMIVPYFNSWAVGSGAPNTISQVLNGTLVVSTALLLIPRFGYVGASLAQLWIIVISIGHILWVRSQISRQPYRWDWLRAYVSPALMAIVWLMIGGIGGQLVQSESLAFFCLVVLGGGGGVLVASLVEQLLFPAERRWETLSKALMLLLKRIQNMAFPK